MRQADDLSPRIASFAALGAAVRRAALGKRRKPGVAAFLARLEGDLLRLERELLAGTWRPGRPSRPSSASRRRGPSPPLHSGIGRCTMRSARSSSPGASVAAGATPKASAWAPRRSKTRAGRAAASTPRVRSTPAPQALCVPQAPHPQVSGPAAGAASRVSWPTSAGHAKSISPGATTRGSAEPLQYAITDVQTPGWLSSGRAPGAPGGAGTADVRSRASSWTCRVHWNGTGAPRWPAWRPAPRTCGPGD